jgi:spermidine/putrescine transport system ATP-binding protein
MIGNIVELKNVTKSFGDYQALMAIDLAIKNGEFLTLLGPSGCGKTTILRLISGLEKPDQGQVYLNNADVTNWPPEHRHINMVFQSYALFPHMTIFDNVAFGLRCKKIPPKEIEERVEEILRIVKLTKYRERKPHQLSGGQQQRVAIARAVVNQPLVLLLDEPLSALDYNLRKDMQVELKQLQRKLGITFIFVTHDQEEALSMSDRVVVMNEGRIEQIGTPRDIYEEPTNIFVAEFIGETNIFTAKVIRTHRKTLEVDIEDRRFIFKNKRGFKSRQEIYVIIRPEDLAVWRQEEIVGEDKSNMLPGKVEQVIYKGSTVELTVRLESNKRIFATEFFNEDDEKLEYQIGAPVWVNWIPGWEVILPYEN